MAGRLWHADWHTCITLHLLNTVTFCQCPTCIFNVRVLEHTLLDPCATLQQLCSLVGFPCWGAHINKWWWWRDFYFHSSPVYTVAALGEQVNLPGLVCVVCSMQGSVWPPCAQQVPCCTDMGPSISQNTLPHKQACWHAPSVSLTCHTAWKNCCIQKIYQGQPELFVWVADCTCSLQHLHQQTAPAALNVYSLKTGIWVRIVAWSVRISWNHHWGRDGRSRAYWSQILQQNITACKIVISCFQDSPTCQ